MRSSRKTALITGVNGQDGDDRVELLPAEYQDEYGTKRPSSSFRTGRDDAFYRDPVESDTRFLILAAT